MSKLDLNKLFLLMLWRKDVTKHGQLMMRIVTLGFTSEPLEALPYYPGLAAIADRIDTSPQIVVVQGHRVDDTTVHLTHCIGEWWDTTTQMIAQVEIAATFRFQQSMTITLKEMRDIIGVCRTLHDKRFPKPTPSSPDQQLLYDRAVIATIQRLMEVSGLPGKEIARRMQWAEEDLNGILYDGDQPTIIRLFSFAEVFSLTPQAFLAQIEECKAFLDTNPD